MTPEIGHNSKDEPATAFAKDQLKALVERIEFVENEIAESQNDRKEIYLEAKSAGFDCKAIRTILRMKKQDASKRAEEEAILDTYLHSLGMFR